MPSIIKTRKFQSNTAFCLAASLMVAGLFSAGQALAAGPAGEKSIAPVPDQVLTPADQALAKDVSVLENRFFFHQYRHDPMEKRLERLELLTLGAAQGGANPDRLTRLKQAVVERDKEAAKTIAKEQKGDGELAAKTNYPILGTLEWRMLKKTYANESIDQRLARMETQLFGLPANTMSYIDRIERLKKTVGMDVIPQVTPHVATRGIHKGPIGLNGPLPRAGRGGAPIIQIPQIGNGNGGKNGSGYLYDADGNVTGWYQNNSQSWSFPGNSAGPGTPGGSSVFDAMDQMNRQMNEMMRRSMGGMGGLNGMGGMGGFGAMPEMNDENTHGFSIHIGPDGIKTAPIGGGNGLKSKISPPQAQPAVPAPKKFTAPKDELPAYTDPNSI